MLEPIKFLEGELIHNVFIKIIKCHFLNLNKLFIFKLFTIFVSGNLSQYMDFSNTHKQFISNGMDHNKNINKMRILSLMTLAENSKELSFDLLEKELQIDADEIESFVIDGNSEQLE